MYVERQSFVHRLDARAKIVGWTLLSVFPFVFNDPWYVGVIAVLVVALGALAHCLHNLARARYLMGLFLIVTVVEWQFYLQDNLLALPSGQVTLAQPPLLYGIAAGIRLCTVMMLGIIFVSTCRIEEITVALVRLGVAYRVSFVVATTARLVPVFAATFRSIMEAQAARGLDIHVRNPITRVRRFVPILIPFILFSMRHASQLAIALEAKGFQPRARRTSYLELSFAVRDYLVLVLLVLTTIALLVLRLAGYGSVLPDRI